MLAGRRWTAQKPRPPDAPLVPETRSVQCLPDGHGGGFGRRRHPEFGKDVGDVGLGGPGTDKWTDAVFGFDCAPPVGAAPRILSG